MAVCGNCKSTTTRVRTHWTEDGTQFDECPQCAPKSFEKFTNPSDKKIWMGYEAHPNEYIKSPDGGYDRKPEYRAEQEQRLAKATEEEQEKQMRIEAKKRSERRTTPMDSVELAHAMRRAEEIANLIQAAAAEREDVN
jgi:hypothetical protein